MRILPFLLVLLSVARADDAATVHLPRGARMCVRLPSLDRMDELGALAVPVLEMLGVGGGDGKLSSRYLDSVGMDAAFVDRTRPIYRTLAERNVVLVPAAAGELWEGERRLPTGRYGLVRGKTIVIGKRSAIRAPARAAATSIVAGDVAFKLFVGDLLDEHRGDVEKALGEGRQALDALAPDDFRGVLEEFFAVARNVVFGVESLHYSLSIANGTLVSEGFLETRTRSALQSYLAGAGAPVAHDLAGYLPRSALLVADGAGDPGFLLRDLGSILDRRVAPGLSRAMLPVLGPAAAFGRFMTGKRAYGLTLSGMSGTAHGIWELADPDQALAALTAYDPAAGNKALKGLGLPARIRYKAAASTYRGAAFHELTVESENAQLGAMFAGVTTWMAVDGRYLLAVNSLNGEADLQGLLDTVRKGAPDRDHPHLAAMRRLGAKRSTGISVNVGALKPFGMMAAMFQPDLAKLVGAFPDEFFMSTSVRLDEGNIRWRGDWPLKEMLKLARAVLEEEGAAAPPADEEFD